MRRVAVLVSGGGTNLQALIGAAARGEMPCTQLALVVSSQNGVRALVRAEEAGIPAEVVNRAACASPDVFDRAMLGVLEANRIELVVLAGFLPIVGQQVLAKYSGKIINVHPSLIPSFCGKSYYGLRVHEAALARGVKLTGATVHLVNDVVDGGEILRQKAVPVLPGDDAHTLQRRVMEEAEWVILPQAVEEMCARLDL